MSTSSDSGWQWFETTQPATAQEDSAAEEPSLAIAFARCFATPEGRRVLKHLRGWTMERTCGPSASDAYLRHLEGQRQLVAHVLLLVAQGT